MTRAVASSARGVALLVVAAAANVALAGCAGLSDPASILVKNDTADIVILAVCGSDDCSKHLEPWPLRPGASGGSRIAGKPVYASLTIRNWNTTKMLLASLDAREA
jgi:hypothetical protein